MWFKLFNINRVQVNKVELTALFLALNFKKLLSGFVCFLF
jgi:hypothetical protein